MITNVLLTVGVLSLLGVALRHIVRLQRQLQEQKKQLMILAQRALNERMQAEIELLAVRTEQKELVITLISIVESQDKALIELRKRGE